MCPTPGGTMTGRSADDHRPDAARERRPDRRRAPRSPQRDERATTYAIERLWAVVGR